MRIQQNSLSHIPFIEYISVLLLEFLPQVLDELRFLQLVTLIIGFEWLLLPAQLTVNMCAMLLVGDYFFLLLLHCVSYLLEIAQQKRKCLNQMQNEINCNLFGLLMLHQLISYPREINKKKILCFIRSQISAIPMTILPVISTEIKKQKDGSVLSQWISA